MRYPLHDAIAREDVDAVRLAIANGADPVQPVRDVSNWYNNKTPFDLAVDMNNPEKQRIVAGLLVETGVCDYASLGWDLKQSFSTAHSNQKIAFLDAVRDTPAFQAWERAYRTKREIALWEACDRGDHVKVQGLLDQGVNPNAVLHFKSGRKVFPSTPLEAAGANTAVFDLLMARGATLPEDPARRAQMMELPAKHGSIDMLERLDRLGVSALLKQPKVGGNSPLWQAAHFGKTEAVDWLLAHGADPNGVVKQGKTRTVPLDAVLASKFNLEKKIEIGTRLMDAGAKPELSDTKWKWEDDHRGPFLAALKQHALQGLSKATRKELDLADPEELAERRGRFM